MLLTGCANVLGAAIRAVAARSCGGSRRHQNSPEADTHPRRTADIIALFHQPTILPILPPMLHRPPPARGVAKLGWGDETNGAARR